MKNILKVTILFCLIIGIFIVPSFAFEDNLNMLMEPAILRSELTPLYISNQPIPSYYPDPGYLYSAGVASNNTNYRVVVVGDSLNEYYVVLVENSIYFISENSSNDTCWCNAGGGSGKKFKDAIYSSEYSLYYAKNNTPLNQNSYDLIYVPIYSSLDAALSDIDSVLHPTPTPTYNKNPNVDEFLANTLISMGVKFKTSSSGISIAQAAWDFMTDPESLENLDRLHKAWDIDYAVSYCNAQSNNYKQWYNGYKVSKDVTLALTAFLDYNYEITGTRPNTVATIAGIEVDNFNQNYMPLDSSLDPSNISQYTFYAAQTVTYANGEYLYDNDVIDPLEFDYSSAQVRQFIGYPPSGTITIPSDPDAGTGTITDDPNNPDQKNININFPALDWLADAIQSILDFLRDTFTTLANLLTQLLDAILGLFSDAFEGLTEFGEGFIEFLQTVFTGFSDVLSGFVPTDIATILVTFLALNIGLGLITFVLKGR